MKKIILFLLRFYLKGEKERLVIYKELYENMSVEYSEQTAYGNLYNASIEFLSQNPIVRSNSLIEAEDFIETHNRINSILNSAHMKTVNYISEKSI